MPVFDTRGLSAQILLSVYSGEPDYPGQPPGKGYRARQKINNGPVA
ncbi:MAG: hypothetical protein R6X28_04850 [Bacteroidales bacterium]